MATTTGYIDFTEGTAVPTTPDTTHWRIYAKSGGVYYVDDAGTETGPLVSAVGAGSVATDAIWDAAGDLAVGTGADTAARLGIGNAGGALSRVNGAVAWNSGTAFPSAATGDRYWRTDLGMEAYYDGTRWLTTQIFTLPLMGLALGNTNSPAALRGSLWHSDYQAYLLNAYVMTLVSTTNNGSHYWTVAAVGAVTSTSYGSFTTAADTAGTYTGHKAALNVAAGATERGINLTATLTGTPGAIFFPGNITYRLILT